MGKRIKNFLIYAGVRLGLGLLGWLRLPRALRWGRRLGRIAYRFARTERRRCDEHIALALPALDEQARRDLARRVFENLGQGVAEVVCAARGKIPELARYVALTDASRQVLDTALGQGRGVVFVTGHCGNWELMARGLAACGYPIHTIGQKSYDPRFTRLLDRFRLSGGVHTVWRGEPDIFERMARVLRDKAVMGLLIDQDTRVPSVFVDFFGRPASTPTAAAVLARKCRAAVVTGFNHRQREGGLVIEIEPFPLCDEQDFKRAVAEDTRALTARIERFVRAHPDEWIWMHRRWKTKEGSDTFT
ncbi:MAG: lysophospholipid acyltransferase family protein [Deltaproteobacteria bacterium]|nr:lysophospholipid acyltransferase family protein [Deltaproteobacteria bacterium]